VAASYPTSIKGFTTKNVSDTIQPDHVNDVQLEIAAVETGLLAGFVHAITPNVPDTYDLGGVSLTWRDLYLRRTAFITQGTITADRKILDASVTWNNAGVTFTGLKLNVTDTASNAASLLVDLQVAAASKFSVSKVGDLTAAGTINGHALAVGSDPFVLLTATQTLTNKTLTAPIATSIGPTGQLHTIPAVTSDTFTLNAAAQTLTNKTLTTATVSALTSGRVVYAGASGLLSDTTGLQWDNSARTLRIESAGAPQIFAETDQALPVGRWRWVADGGAFRLDRNTHASTEFTTFGTSLTIDSAGSLELGGSSTAGTDSRTLKIEVNRGAVTAYSTGTGARGYNHEQVSADTTSAILTLKKARGTFGGETGALNGDILGTVAGAGHNGTTYVNAALIRSTANENFTGSANGSYISFLTTPNGSTTAASVAEMYNTRFPFNQAMARVTKTGTQSVAAATEQPINFDSETFDTDTLHDNVTNNTRLTAPITGKYLANAQVQRGAAVSNVFWLVRIRKQGSTVYASESHQASAVDVDAISVTALVDLAAGEYIEAIVFHSDGVNLIVATTSNFSMLLVGR
jgi:hypothetical protein